MDSSSLFEEDNRSELNLLNTLSDISHVNKKEQEELDDYLWSYEEYSFLPHRTSLDAFDNKEKIIN